MTAAMVRIATYLYLELPNHKTMSSAEIAQNTNTTVTQVLNTIRRMRMNDWVLTLSGHKYRSVYAGPKFEEFQSVMEKRVYKILQK